MSTNTDTPTAIPDENRDGEPGYWPAADFAAKRAAAIMASPRGYAEQDRREAREVEQVFWRSLSERLSALLDKGTAEGRAHVAIHLDNTSPILGQIGNDCGIGLYAWPPNLRLLVWGHKVVERIITEDDKPQATVVFGSPDHGTGAETPIPPGHARQITVAFGDDTCAYTVYRNPAVRIYPWRIDSPDDVVAHETSYHSQDQATDAARARADLRKAKIISAHIVIREQPLTLDQARGCVTVTERMIVWKDSSGE
jgi:hypothetical protein